MGKIFCLMGKSNSGKDTIFKKLLEDIDLNLKPIILYTTRPQRKSEKNGREYYFINKTELNMYMKNDKIIEVREYNTINGKWCYAMIKDSQININMYSYILITTLEAFKNLEIYFGKKNIVPIYIDLDDEVRLIRAIKREKNQVKPNYDELCRRFISDNIDFNNEKLASMGINKCYYNYDLNECCSTIKKDILFYLEEM